MADTRATQVFWELGRWAARSGVTCGPNTSCSWQFFVPGGRRCYVTRDEGNRAWTVSGYVPTHDEELDRTDWVQRVLGCPDWPHLSAQDQAGEIVKVMGKTLGGM